MKRPMIISFMICCLFILYSPSWAAPTHQGGGDRILCYDESSGVEFLCDLNWKMETFEDNKTLITISEDPLVTLTITQEDPKIVFLGQLNKRFFEKKGFFAGNFRRDRVKFAGRNAVEVKGFDKNDPNIRRLSYFLFHDSQLNKVSFSVYPKEKWDQYKFLVKEIADSFSPLRAELTK